MRVPSFLYGDSMKKLKGNCLSCRHCLHEKNFCGGIDAPIETQWDCGITSKHMVYRTDWQDASVGCCSHFEHKLQDRRYLGETSAPFVNVELSCDADRRRKRQRVYFRLNMLSNWGDWAISCDGKELASTNSKSIDLELAIDDLANHEFIIYVLEGILESVKKLKHRGRSKI